MFFKNNSSEINRIRWSYKLFPTGQSKVLEFLGFLCNSDDILRSALTLEAGSKVLQEQQL